MSYEGYEQHICGNGHQFDTDASYHFGDSDSPKCRILGCESRSVFCNNVDQTNTQGDGVIEDWDSLLIAPAKTETCGHCNHTKTVSEATYRIPTGVECDKLRQYYCEFCEFVGTSDELYWHYELAAH